MAAFRAVLVLLLPAGNTSWFICSVYFVAFASYSMVLFGRRKR